MVPQLNPRHLWALLSTASAASSTLIYLYFFLHKSDSAEFVHLYSTTMLFCSWVNTACYFFLPRVFASKSFATIILIFTIAICVPVIRYFVFSETTGFTQFAFILGLSGPTILAPTFRDLFASGNFRYVYKTNIAVNFVFFFSALIALYFNSSNAIYLGGFIALPICVAICLWNGTQSQNLGGAALAALINPTFLILERSLFDQRLLVDSGTADFTIYYYLISRGVTFIGTVLFAIGIERSFHGKSDFIFRRIFYVLSLSLLALSLMDAITSNIKIVATLGQIAMWIILYWLTPRNRNGGKAYFFPLAICALEACFHWVAWEFIPNPNAWVLRSLALSFVCLGFIEVQNQKGAQAN